ncbi:unnamed protein product, partial [Polarella glacialis]
LACLPGKRRKHRHGKAGETQALYLPISSQDEDSHLQEQAREVRSRTQPDAYAEAYRDTSHQAANGDALLRSTTPACALAFHGTDVLSWRNGGDGMGRQTT